MKTRNILRYHVWGFTLVELIVVITILVILGTIGFVQLWGFAGSARDSVRISNLQALKKGLDLSQIQTGVYPLPESSVNITASGTIIGYQWFAKEQVEWVAKLSPWATKDPSDTTMYTTYSTNQSQTKMQAMVFLEDGGSVTSMVVPSLVTEAHASVTSDYSKRFPSTTGDSLGILLGNSGTTLNQPVQESGTGVDVVNTSTGYVVVFSDIDTLSGSGTKLVAMKSSMTSPSILRAREVSLVWYWDMETTVWSGLLADLSGNGNSGTASGITIGWVTGNGKNGKATSFNGSYNTNMIDNPELNLTSNFSAGTLFKSNGGLGTIVSNRNWIGVGEGGWNIDIYSNNKLRFIYGNTSSYSVLNSNITVNDNNWHYVFVVIDNAIVTLFLDGKKIISQNINPVIVFNTGHKFMIGGDLMNNTFFNLFYWIIDEVRIYNRALSDSEIQTLYNATK